ncbi:MAG: LytTR family transcriptional regulator DNA-binding domain-containing protein [Polaribacter sp.]
MFLSKSFPYNISLKTHFFIGGILCVFILFIIFFLKPFDTGTSNFPYKTLYFIGFGLIAFFTYFLFHLVSIFYFKKTKIWQVFTEITFCFLFVITSIIIAFYYTEIIINKKPERVTNFNYLFVWFKVVFFGFGILLFISTISLRKRFSLKKSTPKLEELGDENSLKKMKIYGSLKKDSFLVNSVNLVYIKSENNYVTFFYFEDHLLKEKLLRSTLASIKKQLPFFIKIHRSYIVNPVFITSLKGNKQNAKLYLKNIEYTIPVSKPFFEDVNTITATIS